MTNEKLEVPQISLIVYIKHIIGIDIKYVGTKGKGLRVNHHKQRK